MTKSIKQNASNAMISSVSVVNFEHLITGLAIACILHQRMNESFIKESIMAHMKSETCPFIKMVL